MENGQNTSREKNYYKRFLAIDLIILILSISIPLILVTLNQTGDCSHHIKKAGGSAWILGRALGFTTLIWFISTSIKGAKTKKIAKRFHSYPKAKNYHCISAFTTNIVLGVHVLVLLTSNPYGRLILTGKSNHIPFELFVIKIWTGILFGAIMIISSILFYYLKDVKRLKKFGYKRFIRIHHIMLVSTIILAIHIFLINTELLIIFWS